MIKDNFGNEIRKYDIVYFVELDNPKSTFKSPAKIYKGMVFNTTKYYANIVVRNGDNTWETKKIGSKIGLLKRADINY